MCMICMICMRYDKCGGWYHGGCMGVKETNIPEKYHCPKCNKTEETGGKIEEIIQKHSTKVEALRREMETSALKYYKEAECYNKREGEFKKKISRLKDEKKTTEKQEMTKKEIDIILRKKNKYVEENNTIKLENEQLNKLCKEQTEQK